MPSACGQRQFDGFGGVEAAFLEKQPATLRNVLKKFWGEALGRYALYSKLE